MQARGQPGNLVLVPRGTKPGTVITTPQGKVALEMVTGLNNSPTPQSSFAKLDYLVTGENVEQTLDKALASTDSMAMLLRTLRDDLRPSKDPGTDAVKAKAIKLDVAKKVRRALDAQVRTLNELHHFTKNTAAPKVVQRPIQSPRQGGLLKTNTHSTPPRVQDVPELAGMNIGQVVTPSTLNSAVGKNMIISKETISSNIQLVTLSDGRVLAVQTVPGGGTKRPGTVGPKSSSVNSAEVIELDSSDDDSPKNSPPPKKYKPGPKCSKINKPGPKCSKIAAQPELASDSDVKKDKFKMRISLGARSFPEATGQKESDKSDSEASDSSDDKLLKPETIQDSKSSDKENENEDTDEENKSKPSDDAKDSNKSSKKDKDDDSGEDSKDNRRGSNNNNDSKDGETNGKDTGKEGDADQSDKKKDPSEGNAEDEQMEVDDAEECVILQSQLDGAGKICYTARLIYSITLHPTFFSFGDGKC